MMKTLLHTIALIMLLCPSPADVKAHSGESPETDNSTVGFPSPAILDRESAEEYLSQLPLRGPEGLWEFAPDEVTVMILSDRHMRGRYRIYIVDSVDCRLTPGMELGYLEESVDSSKFRLRLMSHWKKSLLDIPVKGTATLDSKGETLIIEGKSVRLSLTPSVILPNLMSLLRMRVGLRIKDPEDRLPRGFHRIFPARFDLPESPAWL